MGKPKLIQRYEEADFGVFGIPLSTLNAVIAGFEMLLGCCV
jgi:hypothetical protein